MANYEKPWMKDGAFFPVYLTPTLHFYFDSKQLFSNLINNPKPDLYNCYSQDNEFGCNIRFENIENLMKVWGSEVGLRYAEKFILVRSIQ